MSAGTITLTNNSDSVAGAGTAFAADLSAGDMIVAVVGGVTYTLPVKSVESDAAATLVKAYEGPTQPGSAWTAVPRDTLNAVTAQLVAETAKALRGLNYDKQNWQQVFSQSKDITVTLPDGTTFDGPSWLKVVELLRDIDLDTITAIAQSVNVDAQQVSTDKAVVVAAEESVRANAAAAANSENNAASSATSASGSAAAASGSAGSAASSAASAKADADRAEAANPDKALLRERNLSDLTSVSEALENLGLSEVAKTVDGAVPIEQGGTGATTAEDAREKLGLGSASTKDIGTAPGNILTVGGIGSGDVIGATGLSLMSTYPSTDGFFEYGIALVCSQNVNSGGASDWRNILHFSTSGHMTLTGVTNPSQGGQWRSKLMIPVVGTSAAIDANGFIKQASPVVKLYGNGLIVTNNESEGVTSERISKGVYRLSGAVMGLCSDTAWHIEVPADENKQPLIWVDYEVEPTGDVIVKTYHRTHPNAPVFARNERDGYDDCEPIDIPIGRWVDLRVQVSSD